MALDGLRGEGYIDTAPDRHTQSRAADAEAAPAKAELAEPRSREEYYRATAGEARSDGVATNAKRSGWDPMEDRPSLDSVRVTPERTTHILDGDDTGGGHRHGLGKPGKTEFPASWNDEKIISTAVNVARAPDRPPVRQDWNDSWLCRGTNDGVTVWVVVLRSGEILTSWPEEGGPGVVRNPKKGHHD